MRNYIFFSKSNWHEVPRLRHQLANLLRENGNDVFFFEKPASVLRGSHRISLRYIEPGLHTGKTRELIHHQLRVFSFLEYINAYFERRQIKSLLYGQALDETIILNFNYDYFFLRDLFPKNKIITVINDDFVAQAKFAKGQHVVRVLAKTCSMSDAVLVVSYPLAKQVEEWCEPHLFLPWSDVRYSRPIENPNRNTILIWAYINQNMDFDLLIETVKRRKNIIFHIVGPVAENVKSSIEKLNRFNGNFVFKEASVLDRLPLDQYFCSAIPYINNVKHIEAVTMSNKTLQLLARGVPIVTHGMPNFYDHSAIINTNSVDTFMEGLDFCRERFDQLQVEIERLVSGNQANNRYEQLQQIIHGTAEGR